MKKLIVFASIIALMCSACSKDVNDEFTSTDNQNVLQQTELVTLTFTPYEMEAITRAATAITSLSDYLDVWITDGTTMSAVHQTKTTSGFGTVSMTLDKTKTYTLYAIAHKSGGAATLADDVISFPDDKVSETFYYTTTFSPATTTSLSCQMSRIVGRFVLTTTDNVPEGTKKMKMTVYNAFTKVNIDGTPSTTADREVVINIPGSYIGQTLTINTNLLATTAEATINIKVQALDTDDEVIQERTFTDVPYKANYKTTYSGTFFIDTAMSLTFTADDWSEYDTINY